jgi:hypothetical protein
MRVMDGAETRLAGRGVTVGTFDATGTGDAEGEGDADPIAAIVSGCAAAAVAGASELSAHPGDERSDGDADEHRSPDRCDSAGTMVCGERLGAARRAIDHGRIVVTLCEWNVDW